MVPCELRRGEKWLKMEVEFHGGSHGNRFLGTKNGDCLGIACFLSAGYIDIMRLYMD